LGSKPPPRCIDLIEDNGIGSHVGQKQKGEEKRPCGEGEFHRNRATLSAAKGPQTPSKKS
jgi:hypothetical protein